MPNHEDASDASHGARAAAPLTRELVQQCLSVLGKNPYSQAFVFTTATLSELHLSDIAAIRDFPHVQNVICSRNQLRSLAPLRDLRLLLSVEAAHNELTQVLDFDIPQCTPENAWVDGGEWIGSLLRRADLSFNRITVVRELSVAHPFLQELRLAHNDIKEIHGIAGLRFLRVLDLSHNRLTSTRGLLPPDATTAEGELPPRLEALEVLLLDHNSIVSIDEVAGLPRLVELNVAYNRMKKLASLEHCYRLQRLDVSHNDVDSVNELNYLMPLPFLQQLRLVGCPVVKQEDSPVLYRARVLRRLQQLVQLDDDGVSPKEKVKALAMHGSEDASRQRVLAKHLPADEFVNYLPPLDFDDDAELHRFYEERYGPDSATATTEQRTTQ